MTSEEGAVELEDIRQKKETVGVEDGRGRRCCRGRKRKKEKILQR